MSRVTRARWRASRKADRAAGTIKMQPRNQNENIIAKVDGKEIVRPGEGTMSRADRARIFGLMPKHKSHGSLSRASKRKNK